MYEKYDLKNNIEKIKSQIVREIPRIFDSDCRKIILYGSCARGDYTNDSDVDVAILTESNRMESKRYNRQIDDMAASIGLDTMAVVNCICLPYAEFEEKKSWYPYFMSIVRDGVVLYER